MISLNKDIKVIISYEGIDYCLKNSEEYKKFVLLITDPKMKVDKNIFKINSDIKDPRWISICTKYKDFFESFLDAKEEIIKTAEKIVDDQIKKDISA